MTQQTFEYKGLTIKNKTSGKFKNVKYLEFYIIGGVLSLLAFLLIIGLIGQDSNEFDQRIESEIERIHGQILAEQYTDVYLQSGRKLIASSSQSEFENRLRSARPQLTGKIEKNCTTFYADMVERLKRNLSMSFQLETVCRMENESIKSYQYFDWRVGDSHEEMKLIWFGTEPRK